jgi:hypothetical protein
MGRDPRLRFEACDVGGNFLLHAGGDSFAVDDAGGHGVSFWMVNRISRRRTKS